MVCVGECIVGIKCSLYQHAVILKMAYVGDCICDINWSLQQPAVVLKNGVCG